MAGACVGGGAVTTGVCVGGGAVMTGVCVGGGAVGVEDVVVVVAGVEDVAVEAVCEDEGAGDVVGTLGGASKGFCRLESVLVLVGTKQGDEGDSDVDMSCDEDTRVEDAKLGLDTGVWDRVVSFLWVQATRVAKGIEDSEGNSIRGEKDLGIVSARLVCGVTLVLFSESMSVELLAEGLGWQAGVSDGGLEGGSFLANFPEGSLGGRLSGLGMRLVTKGDCTGKVTGRGRVNPLNSTSLGQPDVQAQKCTSE